MFHLTVSRCLRVSIAVKRHHGYGKFYKGKHLFGAGLQFRGSVHYHGGKYGSTQADMVLERAESSPSGSSGSSKEELSF